MNNVQNKWGHHNEVGAGFYHQVNAFGSEGFQPTNKNKLAFEVNKIMPFSIEIPNPELLAKLKKVDYKINIS